MARIVPLFSGSKGNSYYVGTANEGVLIDAGRNCKQIELALQQNDIDISNISAIFVTHEHSDHCSAIKVLATKYKLNVYASAGTLQQLEKKNLVKPDTQLCLIEDKITVGNMMVKRIDTPHDAAESCCYRVVTADDRTALIATDMGVVLPKVHKQAIKSDFVVIESNHDINMLSKGSYPFMLKKRILSDIGHLSNDACAKEIVSLVKNGTYRFMLGHLSEENNLPSLALKTSNDALNNAGFVCKRDYTIDTAPSESLKKSVIF